MTTLDAIILGIVQGLTEFLPVSSSGHLQLFQHLLGLDNLQDYILFDLACHLGTLLAIVCVLFGNIRDLFSTDHRRLVQVAIATLPLFPLVFLMKPIKAVYGDPSYLGFFFLLTAAILFLGTRAKEAKPKEAGRPWRDALKIGLWQAAAILPGVSRSGSTITGAKLLGWSVNDAVTFSFLLAIPAILGGTALEGFKLWSHPDESIALPFSLYFSGFAISFLVGMASLRLLILAAMQNKFSYFAWYCTALGIATIIYFH